MKISPEEAAEWGLWTVRVKLDDSVIPDEQPDTDPPTERLIQAYRGMSFEVWSLQDRMKRLAVRLMDDKYISVSELARELNVSRQTLYAWYQEKHSRLADPEAQQPPTPSRPRRVVLGRQVRGRPGWPRGRD